MCLTVWVGNVFTYTQLSSWWWKTTHRCDVLDVDDFYNWDGPVFLGREDWIVYVDHLFGGIVVELLSWCWFNGVGLIHYLVYPYWASHVTWFQLVSRIVHQLLVVMDVLSQNYECILHSEELLLYMLGYGLGHPHLYLYVIQSRFHQDLLVYHRVWLCCTLMKSFWIFFWCGYLGHDSFFMKEAHS